MDWKRIAALVKANPAVFVTALSALLTAAQGDKTLVPDLVDLATRAKSPTDVLLAHPAAAGALLTAVLPLLSAPTA